MKETWNPAEISEDIKPVNHVNADSWNAAELNEVINLFGIKYPVDTWNPAELDEKARNIINDITSTKTITGNPISFKTINGGYAKSCEVTMNPIQDLHGQSAPYPAGGGKNLAKPYSYSSGITSYDGNGNVTISGTVQASDYIPNVSTAVTKGFFLTLPAGTYKPSTEKPLPEGVQLNVVTQNNQSLSTGGSFTLTEETEVLVRTPILQAGTYNWTSGIMLEAGSQATDYAPYSNICPISGRDGLSLNVCGNDFDETTATIINGSLSTETYLTYSNNGRCYAFPCKKNKTYKVIVLDDTINIVRIVSTDTIPNNPTQSFDSIRAYDYTTTTSKIATISSGNHNYIIVQLNADRVNNRNSGLIICESTELATHTATFPSTVYGGEYEFVSGKAKSEWGYISSYNGETITEPWISDRDVYAEGTTPSTGAEVCYKLATPTEITLTPETIELLKGNNTLWTDGDSIELKYTKLALPDDSDGLSLNQKVRKAIEIIKGKAINEELKKEETKKSTTKGRRKKS